MAILRREGGEGGAVEEKIVACMIISTRFCFEVERRYKPDYITSKYISTVIGWILRYFDEYGKHPGATIMDIYEVEKSELERSESRIIFTLLARIRRKYNKKNLNVDYILDKAKEYFKQRATTLLFERGEKLVAASRLAEADALVEAHKEVSVSTSKRFNPFDRDSIITFRSESLENRLFSMPDYLGEYLGSLEKGWLVSIAGPEKRGKTWWLMEFAYQALMAGLRVIFFSLEMADYAVKVRLYKRLTGFLTDRELLRIERSNIDYVRYPVFDCEWGRHGKCKLKRGKRVRLESYDDFSPSLRYKPCTDCRVKDPRRYKTDYWFDYIPLKNIKTMTLKAIERKVSDFTSLYRDNFRVRTFPRFSATFKDIKRELDDLAYSEDFIPQVVVVDYFDIMASETFSYQSERTPVNATWMTGGQLAAERHCCVITGDQTKMKSRNKINIGEDDTTEDKRKDAHVDMKVVLNQTGMEYNHGIMRLNLLFHRHRETPKNLQAMVTQSLKFGQPLMDSERFWREEKGGESE